MTVFEKIKAMSLEEMAESFNTWCHCSCCPAREVCNLFFPVEKYPEQVMRSKYLKIWLESEVKEDVSTGD